MVLGFKSFDNWQNEMLVWGFFSIDKNIVPKYRTKYHPGKDLIDYLTNYNKWTKDFVCI